MDAVQKELKLELSGEERNMISGAIMHWRAEEKKKAEIPPPPANPEEAEDGKKDESLKSKGSGGDDSPKSMTVNDPPPPHPSLQGDDVRTILERLDSLTADVNKLKVGSTVKFIQKGDGDIQEKNKVQRVYQMFEEGISPVDVMVETNLTPEQVHEHMKRFNELKDEERKRDVREEAFLYGWYELSKQFGEFKRGRCNYYDDDIGICTYYKDDDIPQAFRRRYPGLYRTVSNKPAFMVRTYPSLCCICAVQVKIEQ